MNAPSNLRITSAPERLLPSLGAVLIFSMHAGFSFLEAGSVRKKNIVNALTRSPPIGPFPR